MRAVDEHGPSDTAGAADDMAGRAPDVMLGITDGLERQGWSDGGDGGVLFLEKNKPWALLSKVSVADPPEAFGGRASCGERVRCGKGRWARKRSRVAQGRGPDTQSVLAGTSSFSRLPSPQLFQVTLVSWCVLSDGSCGVEVDALGGLEVAVSHDHQRPLVVTAAGHVAECRRDPTSCPRAGHTDTPRPPCTGLS